MEGQEAGQRYVTMVESGRSPEEIVSAMKEDGFSIVQSVITLSRILHISPQDAKILVTSHQEWAIAVRNAEPLHDEIEAVFGKLKESNTSAN